MPEQRPERRLAAILAADVVGYSRLMEADEAGTLARLKAVRAEVIAPKIAEFGGRLFKTTGDGLLVEFPSAVAAVEQAVALQRELAARNEAAADAEKIAFRIGISLGDVLVEGDDLYGTGVNVAARMETLAEPGGICVSGTVHEHVKSAVSVEFDDLGPQQVKNIAAPVRSFRVVLGERTTTAPSRPAAVATAPATTSIAVLPFDNLSSDPEQEYFSDGISEDVITDLSKISDLLVIARNSTFVYKGHAVDIKQVAAELGVTHVLEGSVRKAGNRVRVNAQLIEGATGLHVWAERYDRDIDDIFTVQDELTREIVAALKLHLTEQEKQGIAGRGTDNFRAYDLFLRGRELIWLHTKVEGETGRALLHQAIELDPGFGKAYAFLSFSHGHEYINNWVDDPEASLALGTDYAEKAVALAPQDPECHWALGINLLWRRDHEGALREGAACIALEPNSSLGHVHLGLAQVYAGEPEKALATFDVMWRLDPHFPDIYLHFVAQAHFSLGQYSEAAEILEQRNQRNPNSEMSRVLLAATYGHLGRLDDARTQWREALRVNPSYSLEQRRGVLPFRDPAEFDRMEDGLRKAGLPE